jgi:hypothetical protein
VLGCVQKLRNLPASQEKNKQALKKYVVWTSNVTNILSILIIKTKVHVQSVK